MIPSFFIIIYCLKKNFFENANFLFLKYILINNMDIKKITTDIINMIILEVKEEENLNKIKKEILRPTTNYILEQIYPYLILSVIIFVLTFLIATITLVFLLRTYTN